MSFEDWENLPWKHFEKMLFDLQHKVYKSVQKNNWNQAEQAQSLLLDSECSRYLAVREVLNSNKNNPKFNSIVFLNYKDKLELVNQLRNIYKWKPAYGIDPSVLTANMQNSKFLMRILKDRSTECLIRYALEPVYEAYKYAGKVSMINSPHDIQHNIYLNLRLSSQGYLKTIFYLDISKCFDQMNKDKFMSFIILPQPIKNILSNFIGDIAKDKIVSSSLFDQMILPLIKNIALYGLESMYQKFNLNDRMVVQSFPNGFRYGNSIIFFLEQALESVILSNQVDQFLKKRGLISEFANIRIIKPDNGFDFVDWHFKVKPKSHKFLCYPTKVNRKEMINYIKKTMRDTRYPIEDRLIKVKSFYHNWCYYHRYSDLSQINLWSIAYWTYKFVKKTTKMKKVDLSPKIRAIFSKSAYKSSVLAKTTVI